MFQNSKKALASKKGGNLRYYKSVGLGFKTPRAAIEGTYVDKKCPWTGNVSIRGRILKVSIPLVSVCRRAVREQAQTGLLLLVRYISMAAESCVH